MAKIVAIDSDAESRETYETQLAREGHTVQCAATGARGLEMVGTDAPDLVLLDLQLDDVDGNETLRALKRGKETAKLPVIVVTARGDEIDRIVAFELGADDFVAKPFSTRELALRARAVLRRRTSERRPAPGLDNGRVRVDRLAHRVWVDDREVELSLLEFRILNALCEEHSRVRTREDLLDTVWGPDSGVSVRSVDAYVKRLRKKLGPARHCIETVRGVGYRLANRAVR